MAADDITRPPAALPPGTRLDEFELRRVLGIGGFGIVYLAFDHALERTGFTVVRRRDYLLGGIALHEAVRR